MKQETLIQLARHQSYPCLALFMTTHPLMPDRYTDKHRIKELFNKLKFLLVETNNQHEFNLTEMLIRTEDLLHTIDFNHQRQGLGLYISPEIAEIISFPFVPKERIVLNSHFPLRELFYLNQLESPFHLLALHKDSISLFEGSSNEIDEVHNENFPMFFEDTYEYQPGVGINYFGGTIPKQFEKEKSFIIEKRTEQFYRQADEHLVDFIYPIYLSGEAQHLHDFLEITQNKAKISGTIPINFRDFEKEKLTKYVSDFIQNKNQQEEEKLIAELNELSGNNSLAEGIMQCWQNAHKGNGLNLIMEYDIFEAAYLSADETQIKKRNLLHSRNLKRVPDLAEKIIQEVVNKGGTVRFVSHGTLTDFQGIAMKLRYPDNS
ncbi:MAG: hypothetical protein LW688_01330 [Cryomorphaceae bacterium]|jgi:hypothetical protein|nr:hypothetical protein [Cryomorphaceae bacterium]